MPTSPARPVRPATLAQAAVSVGLLVGLLAGSVALFGDASSSGPNQIALMLAAGAGAIGGFGGEAMGVRTLYALIKDMY